MEEKVTFTNSKGQKLVGILHKPDKEGRYAGIIICHGFIGGKDLSVPLKLSEFLVKEGYVVLRFDFTGNGESEGEIMGGTYSQEIDDLGKAIDFLQGMKIGRIGIIGHSMGGDVAILRVADDKRPTVIISLSAPDSTSKIGELLGSGKEEVYEDGSFSFKKEGWGKFKVPKIFLGDLKKHDVLKAASAVRKPFLVIQGGKDEAVSKEEAYKIYEASPSEVKNLNIIEGANHSFENPDHTKELKSSWQKYKKTFTRKQANS